MLQTLNRLFLLVVLFSLTIAGARGQGSNNPDLTQQPTLYVVGYAHLDTQWRWEYPQVIREYLPPDCFGFPASLPSILAHMGLKGFSTQKLTWGSAARVGGPGSIENTPVGIPFNVGFWEGPDGRGVIAAFNPGSYGGQVREDISKSPIIADPNARNNPIDWPGRVTLNGKASRLLTD